MISDKVNAGEAILSLRQWTDKPYRSPQVEILQLTKMEVQCCKYACFPISGKHIIKTIYINGDFRDLDLVAKNDGLSTEDFMNWFKKDFDGCVIHFSDFLY